MAFRINQKGRNISSSAIDIEIISHEYHVTLEKRKATPEDDDASGTPYVAPNVVISFAH